MHQQSDEHLPHGGAAQCGAYELLGRPDQSHGTGLVGRLGGRGHVEGTADLYLGVQASRLIYSGAFGAAPRSAYGGHMTTTTTEDAITGEYSILLLCKELEAAMHRWQKSAEEWEKVGHEAGAKVALLAVAELERLSQYTDALLTAQGAAWLARCSEKTIRRMLAEGRLENHGRPGAPKVRLRDLGRVHFRSRTPTTSRGTAA